MTTQTILTPYFLDQHLPGLEELLKPDWVRNFQDLPGSEVLLRMSALHGAIAREVDRVISANNLPVSIAGDCCTTIGVLSGLKRAGIDPFLIWFDAHGDFNTRETSPSGFLGGMPLAILAGLGDQNLLELLDLDPLPQEQIILTDGRDLDPGEMELVTSSEITHLKDPAELLDYSFPDRPIWVHFDTDVVDPLEIPAQNYLAEGGPNKEQLGEIFQHLAETGQIQAVSLSSWAPDLPGSEQSRDVSLELLEILKG
ncbi:MAG: arginase family protein [Anaerolineales bacterium]